MKNKKEEKVIQETIKKLIQMFRYNILYGIYVFIVFGINIFTIYKSQLEILI